MKRSGKQAGDESKRMLLCNALLILYTSMQAVRANNIVMYVLMSFWDNNDHGKKPWSVHLEARAGKTHGIFFYPFMWAELSVCS